MTNNGSIEGPILNAFVRHVLNTARKNILAEEAFLLFVDGCSSRKHPGWIEYWSLNNMEAVINAANTSQILQPCDQWINQRYHELIRDIRDEFTHQGCVDTTRVNFNLAFAVIAWQRITPKLVQALLKVTGTFPFRRNFEEKYKTYKYEQQERVEAEGGRLHSASLRRVCPLCDRDSATKAHSIPS